MSTATSTITALKKPSSNPPPTKAMPKRSRNISSKYACSNRPRRKIIADSNAKSTNRTTYRKQPNQMKTNGVRRRRVPGDPSLQMTGNNNKTSNRLATSRKRDYSTTNSETKSS